MSNLENVEEESLTGLAVLREYSYRNGNMDAMMDYTVRMIFKILIENVTTFFESEGLQFLKDTSNPMLKYMMLNVALESWLEDFPKLKPPFPVFFIHESIMTMYLMALQHGIEYKDYWEGDRYKIDIKRVYNDGLWEFQLLCDDMSSRHPLRSVIFPQVVLPLNCECPVCLQEVVDDGTQCNCGNYFHIPCLKAQIEDSRCPLCREDMVKMYEKV